MRDASGGRYDSDESGFASVEIAERCCGIKIRGKIMRRLAAFALLCALGPVPALAVDGDTDAAVLAQTAQAPALAGAAEAAPDIAQAAEEAAPAAGTGDVMPVEENPVQEGPVQEELPVEGSPDAEPPAAKAPMEKRVAPADPEPAEDPIERGQAIAQANCGRCHAVGDAGESPEPKAPPFRDLHKLYPVESLAESLAEGIVTGHPDMPAFELTAPQVNALISYLKTL